MRFASRLATFLLLSLAFSGCLDDDADDEDAMADADDMEDMQDERVLPDQLEFSFGPGLGCEGFTVGPQPCLAWNLGPGAEGPDGYWVPLGDAYTGLSMTSSAASVTGDTDCYFTGDGGADPRESHGGSSPCSGVVPAGSAWLFIFSYVEPHQGLTVTFTA